MILDESTPERIILSCARCEEALNIPNQGLGRAFAESWRTQHQHDAPTPSMTVERFTALLDASSFGPAPAPGEGAPESAHRLLDEYLKNDREEPKPYG